MGIDGRYSGRNTANNPNATTAPASGPAAPISSNAWRDVGGERRRMTAPKVPKPAKGIGRKTGSDNEKPCAIATR